MVQWSNVHHNFERRYSTPCAARAQEKSAGSANRRQINPKKRNERLQAVQLPSRLLYARGGQPARKICRFRKKRKPPGGKAHKPPGGQHFLLNSTLHSLRHDARRVNLPQNPRRARITMAKQMTIALFTPLFPHFRRKNALFFRKMQDLACNTLIFIV